MLLKKTTMTMMMISVPIVTLTGKMLVRERRVPSAVLPLSLTHPTKRTPLKKRSSMIIMTNNISTTPFKPSRRRALRLRVPSKTLRKCPPSQVTVRICPERPLKRAMTVKMTWAVKMTVRARLMRPRTTRLPVWEMTSLLWAPKTTRYSSKSQSSPQLSSTASS